jgi:NagD protein
MSTVLVLTGVTRREEAERYPYRPSRIVDSITDLLPALESRPAFVRKES